jgi:hypothetical protein
MTENELLDALAAELTVAPIEPDEITARMLSLKIGVSERQAYNILNQKVDAGELETRIAKSNSRQVRAYKRKTM